MKQQTASNLGFDLVYQNQSQKEVTINEGMITIDGVLNTEIIAIMQDHPPSSPELGALYHIGTAPTDAWSEHPGSMALYTEGGWSFFFPKNGLTLWLRTHMNLVTYYDQNWIQHSHSLWTTYQEGETSVNLHQVKRLVIESDFSTVVVKLYNPLKLQRVLHLDILLAEALSGTFQLDLYLDDKPLYAQTQNIVTPYRFSYEILVFQAQKPKVFCCFAS